MLVSLDGRKRETVRVHFCFDVGVWHVFIIGCDTMAQGILKDS